MCYTTKLLHISHKISLYLFTRDLYDIMYLREFTSSIFDLCPERFFLNKGNNSDAPSMSSVQIYTTWPKTYMSEVYDFVMFAIKYGKLY